MKHWLDEEVVSLFRQVESVKSENKPAREAFEFHAKKYGRKTNSVRNYYYFELNSLKNDEKRAKNLKIDLNLHQKNHFQFFDDGEQQKMLQAIEELKRDGKSVRSACFSLSNGDLKKMTRLQNKYQNLKRKSDETTNIIKFEKRQKTLTDADLNSLFLGLIKLVKKSAVDEFFEKANKEKETAEFLLKRAFADLNKKDALLAKLQKDLFELRKENEHLKIAFGKDKTSALKRHLAHERVKIEQKNG